MGVLNVGVNFRRSLIGFFILSSAGLTSPSTAHEFWISPQQGQVSVGDEIVGDLKVGIRLKGNSYPYLPNRFQSFKVFSNGSIEDVAGTVGDVPALNTTAKTNGLTVVAHQTIAFRATYNDAALFARYLTEEGLTEFAPIHRARGLPESGFAERYTRCAKLLVQVGPARSVDKDVAVGMPLELVAQNNPYKSGATELKVTLLWQGKPLANRQVTIFHDTNNVTKSKNKPEAARILATTDEAGRATIPLSGPGEYLLNAVQLEPVDDNPVKWQSHWATLGFKL